MLNEYFIHIINITRNTLMNFSDISNCKAAILVLTNLVTMTADLVAPHLDEFIPIIFKIIQDENAHYTLKPLLISLIGDLFMNFPNSLTNGVFFNNVNELLFSACEASLVISENIETEYYANLKKVIIEAFTSITFSVRDLSHMTHFSHLDLLKNYSVYIERIFIYIEKLLGISEDCDSELIISCLAFITDVVQMYPSLNINKSLIEVNLQKLKFMQFSKEKYTTIDWIKKILKAKDII